MERADPLRPGSLECPAGPPEDSEGAQAELPEFPGRLLPDAASPEEGKREKAAGEFRKLGLGALGILRWAGWTLEGAGAERVRALHRRLLYKEGLWRRVALPGRETSDWRKVMEQTWNVTANGSTLPDLLKEMGIAAEIRAPIDRTFTFKALTVRLETLLEALTAPFERAFMLEDGKVVIDTPAKIAAALEKRP